MLQLSFEWHIREKAFEMVHEDGWTLPQALKAARADPELRSAALGSTWQALSVVPQMENADLVLAAAGGSGGVRRRARR